jgi:hypothetical protein
MEDLSQPHHHTISIADVCSGRITEREQARGVDVAEADGSKKTSNLEWGAEGDSLGICQRLTADTKQNE